jgi:hypothetical protein
VTYTPSNSSVSFSGNIVLFSIDIPNTLQDREFRISTSAAKTNAGGTLSLNISGDQSGNLECYNCFPFRLINGGEIVGTPGPTLTRTAGPASGSTFPLGTTTVTYQATDGGGNSAQCSFTVTVVDDVKPTFTKPSDKTIYTNANCGFDASTAITGIPSNVSDNCGGVLTPTFSDAIIDGPCPGTHIITRIWKLVDSHGNNANDQQQVITVLDNTPPIITCPQPIEVSCTGMIPPPDIESIVTHDNCSSNVIVEWVSDVITNQTCTNKYTISRKYKATDGCNNSSTCIQTITVNDHTPPQIVCPNPIEVQCASMVPAPSPNSVAASDNCGHVIVTWTRDDINPGSCANRFTISRYYTATDDCGNSTMCSQVITVNDNVPPIFTRPSDKIIPFIGTCDYDASANTTGFPTGVSDNCTGNTFITSADLVQRCGYDIVIKRTWSVADECGNVSSQTQMITATDNNTPYVIYASKEAKFGENNTIGADVGVTDANGKAEFKKNDVLDPNHVYAKNITVQMPATVTFKHLIPAIGGPHPEFMNYVANPLTGNYTQSVNGDVPAGNYKDLTIKKGVTARINGSNYGKVKIEEGASVTFNNSNINLEELSVAKGKNPGTTNVYFTNCTGVKIKDKVSIEENCRVNVDGPKVNFYLGDSKKDEENFTVKGDNTQVTLNIMVPNGKLKINGGANNCIMKGYFIVEKLESDGKNVSWNKYSCTPAGAIAGRSASAVETEVTPTETIVTPVTETVVSNVIEPVSATVQQDRIEPTIPASFSVKVYPNPSSINFRIVVNSTGNEPISVRLLDMHGRILQVNPPVLKGSTITLGNKLPPGVYYADVRQGNNKELVKLVKLD